MTSILENVDLQDSSSIGFTFTNFVYTVIEHSIKCKILNPTGLVQETPEIERQSETTKIVQSYSDEEDAKSLCESRNSSHAGFNPPWLKTMFGSSLSYSNIDPVTYEVNLTVTFYDYVKNELHGALLEK